MKILKPEELKDKTVRDLFFELESSEEGLNSEEVGKRLEAYGRNEITEKKTNPILRFLKNFWSSLLELINFL